MLLTNSIMNGNKLKALPKNGILKGNVNKVSGKLRSCIHKKDTVLIGCNSLRKAKIAIRIGSWIAKPRNPLKPDKG